MRPRLVVNDAEMTTRAAAAGLGIAPAPLTVAAPTREKLLAVLSFVAAGHRGARRLPPGGALVPKTRAFLDMLQECFRGESGGRRSEPRGQRVTKALVRAGSDPRDVAVGSDQHGRGSATAPSTGSSHAPA